MYYWKANDLDVVKSWRISKYHRQATSERSSLHKPAVPIATPRIRLRADYNLFPHCIGRSSCY